jgi:pyruvate/2-oxoglutarate dehydrogenase complex dihydrolipoamide dehydrogenase (E3) component/anti-anti-sigma regulatory factor
VGKPNDFDVVVIGAGIAGLVSAVTAKGLGQSVAIVEKRRFGGNCGSYTCLPSKTLIRAGHVTSLVQHIDHFGLKSTAQVNIDTTNLMSHVRSVVQKAYEKDVPDTFERIGIETIEGQAEFIDNHHIRVDDRIVMAKRFIIAAGTRPMVPPIRGLQDINYLTNETLFELGELPASMIILGGGIDGLEFASALSRLGVDVTVVEMASRLLPNDDTELVNMLLAQLQCAGVRMLTGTKASSVQKEGNHIRLDIEQPNGEANTVKSDALLLTIGRKAELEGLRLENAQIDYTPRGIITNSKMQTSTPNIYACGDIVGPYQLASIAEYQGMIAATNAVLPVKRKVDYTNAVFVIFTEPTLAHIGLTEEQARKKHGDNITVYRFDYSNMRRALVDGNDVGLAKFICDRKGRLIGAHILGEGAAEVIHEAQLVKVFDKPLYKVQNATHAYPTYAQALLGRASQLAFFDHMSNNFWVKQFFRFFPGYENRLSLARQRLAETEETSLKPYKDAEALDITVTAHEPFGKEIIVNALKLDDNVCLLELPEELTDPDERPYLNACVSQVSDKENYVILDFGVVQMMNGLGATMLVKFSALAKHSGQLLLAIGVSDHYRDVLRVTGLDRTITICGSREEACAAARVSGDDMPNRPLPKTLERDSTYWAKPTIRLSVPAMPPEAINRNMNGRSIVGPVDGFGQLWQKMYRLRVTKAGSGPEDVIRTLKQNFPRFQPSYNRFYPTEKGLQPGEVVAIDSSTPGGPVSTGVMVLYADERSFTFITPQGHPESGWVSFSAFETNNQVIVQILGLARANDPIYEAAFRTVGSKMQVKIWKHVLTSLATYLGIPAEVTVEAICVDPRMQWTQIGNSWYNAQVRTMFYMPIFWSKRIIRGKSKEE